MSAWEQAPIVGDEGKPKAAWESAPLVGKQAADKPTPELQDGEDQVSRYAKSQGKGTTRADTLNRIQRGTDMPGLGLMADMGMGTRQVLDAAAQLAARGAEAVTSPDSGVGKWAREQRGKTETVNQEALDTYTERFAPEGRGAAADIARGFGQAAATLPVTPAIKAGGLIKGIVTGAGLGAESGALTPVYGAGDNADFASKKGRQMGEGAAAGAVGSAVLTGAAKALSPIVEAAQQTLAKANIRMTPGQALGGLAKSIEDKATSIPLVGEAINSSRRAGIEDFNKAVYGKALEPFGDEGAAVVKASRAGREGITKVGDFLSAKYEDALARSVPNVVDDGFRAGLTEITAMVPRGMRDDFTDIVQRSILQKVTPGGTLTPSVAKSAESELGRLAAGYRGSSVESERQLGSALREAQSQLRDLVARNNPEVAPQVQAANQGWRTLVQMENAGAMLGAKDGIFTPAQFLNAVKKSDTSVRDRQFARGDAFNQEFATAADKVLPNKYPDSGTAGRMFAGLTAAGGIGAINPAALGAAGVGALAYAPGVNTLVSKAMTAQRPDSVMRLGDLARQSSPLAALLAGISASQ